MVHVRERRVIWEFGLAFVKLIVAAAVVYGVFVGYLYTIQRRILFVPGTLPPDRIEAGVPDMREVDLVTEDGLTLRSWYRPADPGCPTLVYFQGNAGTIAGRGFKARAFLDRGLGVLLVGHRGFGGNPGHPSEIGLITDGRAALNFLASETVGPGDVVLYGESLGSGVAVALAADAEIPVGAVILEAPYTSIVEIAATRYWFVPVAMLLKDRFDSLSRISGVRAPVLILHGEDDKVINVDQGRRLHEAAVEPRRLHLFEQGSHSDLYEHGAAEVIEAFLDEMWDISHAHKAPLFGP